MSNTENAIALIQKLLTEKGVPEAECRSDEENAWMFKLGSFHFLIRINRYQQLGKEGEAVVVFGHIMNVPTDPEKADLLAQELLRLNVFMMGAYFAITEEGQVLLIASRDIEGLDYDELVQMADTVSLLGDEFDDMLIEKFGDVKE